MKFSSVGGVEIQFVVVYLGGSFGVVCVVLVLWCLPLGELEFAASALVIMVLELQEFVLSILVGALSLVNSCFSSEFDLSCSHGKEGVEAKTCTSTDLLEGCTDDFCNDQCIDSHVKEAKGVCVGAPGTTCQCTYPC
ncbi:hypothetical protein V6N13_009593 [Hibiscus sabdariffa]